MQCTRSLWRVIDVCIFEIVINKSCLIFQLTNICIWFLFITQLESALMFKYTHLLRQTSLKHPCNHSESIFSNQEVQYSKKVPVFNKKMKSWSLRSTTHLSVSIYKTSVSRTVSYVRSYTAIRVICITCTGTSTSWNKLPLCSSSLGKILWFFKPINIAERKVFNSQFSPANDA